MHETKSLISRWTHTLHLEHLRRRVLCLLFERIGSRRWQELAAAQNRFITFPRFNITPGQITLTVKIPGWNAGRLPRFKHTFLNDRSHFSLHRRHPSLPGLWNHSCTATRKDQLFVFLRHKQQSRAARPWISSWSRMKKTNNNNNKKTKINKLIMKTIGFGLRVEDETRPCGSQRYGERLFNVFPPFTNASQRMKSSSALVKKRLNYCDAVAKE